MAISPLDAAKLVFDESLTSLMAHTIRGVTNYFEKERIELTVLIAADMHEQIKLRGPDKGATSLLMTNFVKGPDGAPSRLLAKIYIHKNANKHLARVCIAHEIFHLLLELDAYKESGEKKEWPVAPPSGKAVEDMCNQFAWQLCKYHDDFNRRDDLRKKYIFFPEHTFDKPFNMNDTAWYLEWPADIALDPQHPFYKREPLPEPIKKPPL